MVEVRSPGAYASIQDWGRRTYRRVGIPWSGVLDPHLMRVANALVGQDRNHPVIECFDAGFALVAGDQPVRLAVAGCGELEIVAAGHRRIQLPWCSFVLAPGEMLRVKRVMGSRLITLAILGLEVAPVLGSASTYARAGLGGMAGRPLAAGDRLVARAGEAGADRWLPRPPQPATGPIRVVLGPQADHFSQATLDQFLAAAYRVAAAADRMGMRLEGPALGHRGPAEIVSDATVPGSIQVPGNGLPIVLLADAQTAGGYPKIATVISADLPRLAALQPGHSLGFAAVTVARGEDLAREAEARIQALLASIQAREGGEVDTAALYSANLVGGVVHALAPESSSSNDTGQGWS